MRKYKFPIVFVVNFLSLLAVVCFCNTNPLHAASGDLNKPVPRLSGSGHSESTLSSQAVPVGASGANFTPQSAGFDSSVQFTVPGRAGAGGIGEEDSGYLCHFELNYGITPLRLHAAGGTGSLNVRVWATFDDGSPPLEAPGALCPWVLQSNTPWILGQDPSDWTTDSKLVGFHYFNNGGAPRLGKIYIHQFVDIDVLQAGSINCGEVKAGDYLPYPPLIRFMAGSIPLSFRPTRATGSFEDCGLEWGSRK